MTKYTEYLKCDFTPVEITDRAKELAAANRQRNSIEQTKKEIDSDLKSQIEAQNSLIQRLSEQIGMGYEYRNIDCRVELDTPELGKKRIVRLDTGEEVKVVAMTAEDKQASLDLQEQANAEEAKEPIITPPPVLLQIGDHVHAEVATVADVSIVTTGVGRRVGFTNAKPRKRNPDAKPRKRNPDAEGFADGSE